MFKKGFLALEKFEIGQNYRNNSWNSTKNLIVT